MRGLLAAGMAWLCLAGAAMAGPIGVGQAAHGFRNGGFERGDFTGWSVEAPYSLVMDQPYAGFTARRGQDYALLGPRGADGTLSQSFADAAGQTLHIGFWLASDGLGPNDFTASFDGTELLQLTSLPRTGWVFYSADVLATGLDQLAFTARDDAGYLALDAVTIRAVAADRAAVPEPGSLAMLWTGLLGMGAAIAVAHKTRRVTLTRT